MSATCLATGLQACMLESATSTKTPMLSPKSTAAYPPAQTQLVALTADVLYCLVEEAKLQLDSHGKLATLSAQLINTIIAKRQWYS